MTQPKPTSVGAQDRRRVQTAVRGETADSDEGVYLPTDHEEARNYRANNPGPFWCGRHQGGCGRRVTPRIGDDKVPHFYHQPYEGDPCRLEKKNRGRRTIEPVVVWAALRHWRTKRDLPEGDMTLYDSIDPDARYMHISGPSGTRDTRIVLGDYTIEQVIEDARSPQGRKWDWFVNERNDRVRLALDAQGISYARFRFVEHSTSTTMEVFLSTGENVGDWGRVERYEPAPNQAPRPPEPTRAAAPSYKLALARSVASSPADTAVPRQWNAPDRSRVRWPAPRASAPRRSGVPARGRTSTGGPSRRLEQSRRVELKLPDREPEPKKVRAPQPEEKLPDQLREAANDLDEALNRGNRRDVQRCGRSLQKLLDAHNERLSRTDEQWIRHMLSEVGTKR